MKPVTFRLSTPQLMALTLAGQLFGIWVGGMALRMLNITPQDLHALGAKLALFFS